MNGLVETLGTLGDLLLVVFGFGLIVFVHELGHFVAARWAGIRVLAFAVGFGPAFLSWRKGMGLQRGSSEPEYLARVQKNPDTVGNLGATEYRLNVLPLGGYVKMLGQEDMDPTATSDAPDSYQNCTPWKRMVVISAGVVMNMITAAALFVLVLMVGLRVEPPVIGSVMPGGPAATAEPVNAGEVVSAGPVGPGLEPGDEVVSIDGHTPRHFSDLSVAAAIGERGVPVRVAVERAGVAGTLEFDVIAEESEATGLLDFGIGPAGSLTVIEASGEADRALLLESFERLGLAGVEPGMELVRIGDDTDVRQPFELIPAFDASGGEPVELEFRGESGGVVIRAEPVAEFEQTPVPSDDGAITHRHLLGLSGVLMVSREATQEETRQGLRPGDVFARLGEVAYPSYAAGIAAIQSSSGESMDIVVLRDGERVPLTVEVGRDGRIGFRPDTTEETSTLLSGVVLGLRDGKPSAAESLDPLPGSRVVSVAGVPVNDFREIRARLRAVTADVLDSQDATHATVPVVLERAGPVQPDGSRPREQRAWRIDRAELERLHELGWASPVPQALFEPLRFVDKAANPVAAVGLGLSHTRRVMLQTYLTFARLFQGSVKVQHLQGPVGIAHLGTRLADRGIIWLLFFMALISVNLAVINFLPLPIVDGGQFLMLVYEQVRGRPVPIPVQNVVTLAGLVLIGSLFLIVTFNDVTRLLGF
ncbi:MAG: site-2 protease family protein [Phycisphaerales bacterium JB040]